MIPGSPQISGLTADVRERVARMFVDDRPLTIEQLAVVLAKDPSRPLSAARVREILKTGFKARGRQVVPVVTDFGTYRGVRPSDLERFIAELSGMDLPDQAPAAAPSRVAVPRMFARTRAGVSSFSPLRGESGAAPNGMDAVGHRPRERPVSVSRPPRPAGRGGTSRWDPPR